MKVIDFFYDILCMSLPIKLKTIRASSIQRSSTYKDTTIDISDMSMGATVVDSEDI